MSYGLKWLDGTMIFITSVDDNGPIVQIMIQAWHFLEMFFEALRSNLQDWLFGNPRWRPLVKMAAMLHLQVGVGPKKIINMADWNDLDVLLYVLKATGIISSGLVAIWKSKMAPFSRRPPFCINNGFVHRREVSWPIWMILVSLCMF